MIVKNLSRFKEINSSNLLLLEEYPVGSIILALILIFLIIITLLFDFILPIGLAESTAKLIQILFFIPVVFFFIVLIVVILSALYRTNLLITDTEMIFHFYLIIIPIKKIIYSKDRLKVHFYDKNDASPEDSFEKKFQYIISLVNLNDLIIIRYYLKPLVQTDKFYLSLLFNHNVSFDESAKKLLSRQTLH